MCGRVVEPVGRPTVGHGSLRVDRSDILSEPLEVALLLAALTAVAPVALAVPPSEIASIPGANLQRPAWSPDGKRLAFEANFHEKKRIELYVGPPSGGSFSRIEASRRSSNSLTAGFSVDNRGEVVHELAWAPQGIGSDMFVFSASNKQQDYDLYVAGGTSIATSPRADGGAVWAPDGKKIAFTSARTGEGDLYLIDADQIESKPVRLTRMSDSSELYATWSPNGRSLVFVAHSDTGDNLWLLPAVGASPARLTTWSGNQIRPRYSPVDSRVAFYANREDRGRFDLYVVKAGSAPTLLVRGVYPDARGPSWTPDGKHIVYVSDDDDSLDPVRVVNTATKRAVDLGIDTVGNGDLDVAARNGALWVAVVAQGRVNDAVRDFKRLFVAQLTSLP